MYGEYYSSTPVSFIRQQIQIFMRTVCTRYIATSSQKGESLMTDPKISRFLTGCLLRQKKCRPIKFYHNFNPFTADKIHHIDTQTIKFYWSLTSTKSPDMNMNSTNFQPDLYHTTQIPKLLYIRWYWYSNSLWYTDDNKWIRYRMKHPCLISDA